VDIWGHQPKNVIVSKTTNKSPTFQKYCHLNPVCVLRNGRIEGGYTRFTVQIIIPLLLYRLHSSDE